MTISKMKLKYSSLFCIPFVVMLGVFLSLGLTPFSKSSIHSGDFLSQYFPLYIGLHRLFWSGDFSGLFWSISSLFLLTFIWRNKKFSNYFVS